MTDAVNQVTGAFRHRPDIALIDRIKIQSEVMVPLVKTLERALGVPAAHELVRSGVGEFYRNLARELAEAKGSIGALEAIGEICAEEDTIAGDISERSEVAFSFDIVGCRFAQFFREIGEPEIGFLLVCSSDFPLADGLPGVELDRTRTIMQGHESCDFRYRFVPDELKPPLPDDPG